MLFHFGQKLKNPIFWDLLAPSVSACACNNQHQTSKYTGLSYHCTSDSGFGALVPDHTLGSEFLSNSVFLTGWAAWPDCQAWLPNSISTGFQVSNVLGSPNHSSYLPYSIPVRKWLPRNDHILDDGSLGRPVLYRCHTEVSWCRAQNTSWLLHGTDEDLLDPLYVHWKLQTYGGGRTPCK